VTLFVTAILVRFRVAVAWIVVLIIAAGAWHDIKAAEPTYSDGATVIFSLRHPMTNSPAKVNIIDESLVATEVMIAQTTVQYIKIAHAKVQIVAFPCNRSNVEYPDYEEQCATLTATAPGPAVVHGAFWLAYRMMESRLLRMQVNARVIPRSRIQTYLVGMSGPIAQPGSRTRVYAGLGMLALIGILVVTRYFALRRNPISRVRRRGGRRRHAPESGHGRSPA
jgi:hypothetical protein